MLDYTEAKAKVREVLPEKRFRHSVGVAETALFLAGRFSLDEDKALVCGIYHDAYRYSGSVEMIPLLEEKGFLLDEEEKRNPMLLHGPVAAMNFSSFFSEEIPEDMVLAVRHHTLGHKDMGRLGAAIYIADYVEPGRTHISDEEKKRILLLPTLEDMVREIILMQRPYFLEKGMTEAMVSTELCTFLEEGGRL